MFSTILMAAAAATAPVPVISTASVNVGTPSLAVAQTASAPATAAPRPGLNVSGCEFANNAVLCPSVATIDAYADAGFQSVRIPVKSIQLDVAIPKLKAPVAEGLKRGMIVTIDLHDYLPLDPARIVPLVKTVSDAFGPQVWIDYDNEPKAPTGATGDTWVASAKATNSIIAGVRALGVTNVLVAEWPYYSGNYRAFPSVEYSTSACSTFGCGMDRVGGLKDPLGKTVLGPHRYFDSDKSGTHKDCVKTGWYWDQYVTGAEARGYKTLIGETAFGSADTGVPGSCTNAGKTIITQIRASKSIIGYNFWGGGAAWNAAYLFRIPPTQAAAKSAYVQQILGK